ncbi:MAG: beta-hydroxyacyl-ACP dehydratase [Bacteroidales bacterium]|nr:beta-hydroxyacyl-ACP dehydratase [Bacteroidales bacterium]
MFLEDSFYKVISRTENECGNIYKIALNPDHRIYKAHFPGYPVTPGVCVVEIAVELASLLAGRKLDCKGARDIKFLTPIIPTETKELFFEFDGSDSVKVCDGETLFARMRLELE